MYAGNGFLDDFGGGTLPSMAASPGNSGEGEMPAPVQEEAAAPLLHVGAAGERCLRDPAGNAVMLAGAFAWSDLRDAAGGVLDYGAHLDAVRSANLNLVRLMAWEAAPWMPAGATATAAMPYLRTGPGAALDGQPRFDLAQFDPAYFARLRQVASEARQRGIYVVVVLFNGRSLADAVWAQQPFNPANNLNGFSGDPDNNGQGAEMAGLAFPEIVRVEGDYVRAVVTNLAEFDNVLYQVSDDSLLFSTEWKLHMIKTIRDADAALARQHLVGAMAAAGESTALRAGGADWLTGTGAADGGVVLADVGAVGEQAGRAGLWNAFMRGCNVAVFLDRAAGSAAVAGAGLGAVAGESPGAETWANVLANLGDLRRYAARTPQALMTAQASLCAGAACLGDLAGDGTVLLGYASGGGTVSLDLSAVRGKLAVEWYDPATNKSIEGATVDGGARWTLTAPFPGDAVLYLASRSNLYLPQVSDGGN